MKLLKQIAAAAALLAFASTASAQESVTPALYVARDADSTIYLYGTIHLRRTGEPWGAPYVEAALNEAQEIWTETDISAAGEAEAQGLALQRGLAPPGRPLSSWLSADEQARLNAVTGRLGLQTGQLEPLQPWLAGLTLAVLPMMQNGYDPQSGVDRAVVAWANANGRETRWFESTAEQIGFFADMTPELQTQFLMSAVDDAERASEMVDVMSSAWERGDLSVLDALVEEMRRDYPDIHHALLTRRNEAWVETLVQEMEGSGVDFVAVGAGHLGAPDGVVALLQARGVSVERVTPE